MRLRAPSWFAVSLPCIVKLSDYLSNLRATGAEGRSRTRQTTSGESLKGLEAVVYVDTNSHLKKYSFTSGATEDLGVQTTDYGSPVDVTPQGDVVLTVQRQQTGNDSRG
jgi:hypothetical protein